MPLFVADWDIWTVCSVLAVVLNRGWRRSQWYLGSSVLSLPRVFLGAFCGGSLVQRHSFSPSLWRIRRWH